MRSIVFPKNSADVMMKPQSDSIDSMTGDNHVLWIDGVGGFLLCCGESVVVGGGTSDRRNTDVCLMADISSDHFRLVRSGECYLLQPRSRVLLDGVDLDGSRVLNGENQIQIGRKVCINFRMPSRLSPSACLSITSPHRTDPSYDGIVLMHDLLILGPGRDAHIRCHDWTGSLVLYRDQGQFWCRPVEDRRKRRSGRAAQCVELGGNITVSEIQFRLESVHSCVDPNPGVQKRLQTHRQKRDGSVRSIQGTVLKSGEG